MKEELSRELNRYYFLIKTFNKVIEAIELEYKDSNQWFVFCSKIAKKFHTHLTSFVFSTTQDLVNLQIDDIHVSSKLDVSVLYSNLRLQFDTYSTFYHIFLHEGEWTEKIIRFRLWQIDSLITRQTFSHTKAPEKIIQLELEKQEIKNIYAIIEGFDYFKNLTENQRKKIVKNIDGECVYANWKFDKSLLNEKKDKYSWEELALNTGIKSDIYSNMHNFSSMHVHSNYLSILQNEQLTEGEKHASRIVALRLSCYLTSFFLDDLCHKFNSAKSIAESLSETELEIIKRFLKSGREQAKIKYFA